MENRHIRRPVAGLAAFVLVLLLAAGCATVAPPTLSTDEVLAALRREGVAAEYVGPVSRPELAGTGREFLVTGGGTLELYEYRSVASATLDVRRLAEHAPGPTERFYRRSTIVAVYRGTSNATEQRIASVLGARLF